MLFCAGTWVRRLQSARPEQGRPAAGASRWESAGVDTSPGSTREVNLSRVVSVNCAATAAPTVRRARRSGRRGPEETQRTPTTAGSPATELQQNRRRGGLSASAGPCRGGAAPLPRRGQKCRAPFATPRTVRSLPPGTTENLRASNRQAAGAGGRADAGAPWPWQTATASDKHAQSGSTEGHRGNTERGGCM